MSQESLPADCLRWPTGAAAGLLERAPRTKSSQSKGYAAMKDDDLDARDVPFMQKVLDNPFLLLFIGIAVPTLTYIVWGIMELVALPISSP